MSDTEIASLTKKAKFSIKNKEYTDAEYYFKKITQLDPNNWQAWYGRGLCFKRMEMYDGAIHSFIKVTELRENDPKGWYNLGFCHAMIDEIENALYYLNKSIKLDPSFAIAHVIKGWLYYKHDRIENAKQLIQFVKDKYPEFLDKFTEDDFENQPKDYQIGFEMITSEKMANESG